MHRLPADSSDVIQSQLDSSSQQRDLVLILGAYAKPGLAILFVAISAT